jgi:hypothetical protein
VLFALLAAFTFQRLHLSTFHVHPATFAVWTTALVTLISVGGLGWTENGNDYSRYLLRRKRYDTAALAADRGGLYWRNGGVHWPAVVALAAGIVAALMWISAAYDVPSYTGPLSNHFPGLAGGDFSWALGIIVSSLVYWALGARGVRREAEATA